MCDWCMEHGDGKKWYLNIKNYTKDFFGPLKEKGKTPAISHLEELYFQLAQIVMSWVNEKNPETATNLRKLAEERYQLYGLHQVVTLEEVNQILDIASPIAKYACPCERILRAKPEEKRCFSFGMSLDFVREWPDFFRGGVEFLSKEEARECMEKFDEQGFVHAVYIYKKPIVGGFCNCEAPSCYAIKISRERGWNFYKRSHFVANIEDNKCIGCKKCISRCQFGAVSYSPTLNRAVIDPWKCFGCGVCRVACENDAIKLIPRENFPSLNNVWWYSLPEKK
nr:4Fe-4S dicluster domain-containing protein [Candidatus Freyarchaeota archaeon]